MSSCRGNKTCIRAGAIDNTTTPRAVIYLLTRLPSNVGHSLKVISSDQSKPMQEIDLTKLYLALVTGYLSGVLSFTIQRGSGSGFGQSRADESQPNRP